MLDQDLIKRLAEGDQEAQAQVKQQPTALTMQYGMAVANYQEKNGLSEKKADQAEALGNVISQRNQAEIDKTSKKQATEMANLNRGGGR